MSKISPHTSANLTRILKRHARALGIPTGASDEYIPLAIAAAEESLSHRSIITDHDLTRTVAKQLAKYDRDLAYVYKNYDIII